MNAATFPDAWDDGFDRMIEAHQHDPLPPEATMDLEEFGLVLLLGDIERESVEWPGPALALAA